MWSDLRAKTAIQRELSFLLTEEAFLTAHTEQTREHTEQTREHVESQMCDYMLRQAQAHGTPWSAIARHMLGLRHGLPGSRRWRQVWSDHQLKSLNPHEVMRLAHTPATMAQDELILL